MEISKSLSDTEVVSLHSKQTIVIGSSYTDDVYYQYKNLIMPRMVILRFEGEDYIKLHNENREILSYGDEFYIEKLWICYLGKVLLLHAYDGSMRISRRKEYASY